MLLTKSSVPNSRNLSWTASKAADLGECLSTCPRGGAFWPNPALAQRGGYTTPHAIRLIKVVRTQKRGTNRVTYSQTVSKGAT